MTPETKISVIMAAYNAGKYINRTLESILAQTYGDFECIIVDDSSTDDTPDILASYNDERIIIIRNERNLGLTKSLNLAIEKAGGEFIARMDADDISHPERLARQVEFLGTHSEVGLLGTAYEIIDENDRVIGFGDPPLENDELQTEILIHNRFCHGSLMFRREILDKTGLYDIDYEVAQDYDLVLRVAEHCEIANLPHYLYRLRKHSSSLSSTHGQKQSELADDARRAAWRRRTWSPRVYPQKKTISWARAAIRERRPLAASALLTKSYIAEPLSAAPFILAAERLSWTAKGIIGAGKAAEARNEKSIQKEIELRKCVLRSHPSHLTLLMIDKCNAQCVMCGGDYFHRKTGRMLTAGKCERIFGHLRCKKLNMVMFGGAGEPLLNPEFGEIARITRERCPHANLLLITNGIALDETIVEHLMKHRVNALVSINAATRDTYRRISQVDMFDRIVANVAGLAKRTRESGAGIDLTLSHVAHARNIRELPALVKLASEIGANGVSMNYCRFYPRKCRFKEDDLPENRLDENDSLFHHQELSDDCVVEARRLAAELGVRFEHEPLFASPQAGGGRCDYPWRVIFAGFDGEVYWCPGGEVLFEEKAQSESYTPGNLVEQDISEIWNGRFFVDLRRGLLDGASPLPECAVCGNRIEWLGPTVKGCHILDWSGADQTDGTDND